MSIAELNSLYSQASTALAANDFDGAIRAALQAKMRLATTPDASRAVGQGSQALSWPNAAAIDAFIAQVNQLKTTARLSSGGPWMSTRVEYVRPGSTGGGV